jgi:aldose 1-epimerase
MSSAAGELSVQSAPYGTLNGSDITAYTLSNSAAGGIDVTVIDYGAIITSVMQPDRTGKKQNVVLGYDHIQAWATGKPWFNSLIGRHANRITGGKFSIDGVTYQLEQNNNGNHLHGGAAAFNAKIMKSSTIKGKDDVSGQEYVGVKMEFVSPDGEESYPGELHVTTLFKLFASNTLQMEFLGEVQGKPTIVNMCNHAYWNLSGEITKDSTILEHHLRIHADRMTEITKDTMLSTGKILPVADTPFDFRKDRTIGGAQMEELNKQLPAPGGYDHNFVLNKDFIETGEELLKPHEVREGMRASFAARLAEPKSGRQMDVYTTAPGIQCYTGNFLDGSSLVGRDGIAYAKHAAVCLETQSFPDAINHRDEFKGYPDGILRPGEKYVHVVQHRFSTGK